MNLEYKSPTTPRAYSISLIWCSLFNDYIVSVSGGTTFLVVDVYALKYPAINTDIYNKWSEYTLHITNGDKGFDELYSAVSEKDIGKVFDITLQTIFDNTPWMDLLVYIKEMYEKGTQDGKEQKQYEILNVLGLR